MCQGNIIGKGDLNLSNENKLYTAVVIEAVFISLF